MFKNFKNDSKSEAMKLLDSSVAMVKDMQDICSEIFHYDKLSEASSDFEEFADVAVNEKVGKAVRITLDLTASLTTMLEKLDYFITLHIPTIEDGGNFGVGVQLDLVKKLGEFKESANKSMEALLGYQNARAEALGKLNLPSSTLSVTKSTINTITKSSTDGDSSDEKRETKENETREDKNSGSSLSGPVYESKLAAVVAVDTLYFFKASAIVSQNITSFIGVMDFIDKNREKLIEPKGQSGGSNFSMY